MSLQVLLLLSFLTVQCSGCDWDRVWVTVKKQKKTIDDIPTTFRKTFPINYHVVHHYKGSMLCDCDSDSCCVFPAALVLFDSWNVILGNIWNEHRNYEFIFEIRQSLDDILKKNKHTERLEEETDISALQNVSSTPEQLLNLTSALFSCWLTVGCSAAIQTCVPPTLAPNFAERVELPPLRARLLTTRAVSLEEEEPRDKMLELAQQPPNSSPSLSQTLAFVWGPLLFGLLWGLLP